MKAREQRGFVNSSEWDSRSRHFFFILSVLEEGKLLYPILLQQKNNYITMHSKNSIILAGYFDQEV